MLHIPRQSFVDSMIDSAVNSSMLEKANLTKEDVVFAFYNEMVTGWGYEGSLQVVDNSPSYFQHFLLLAFCFQPPDFQSFTFLEVLFCQAYLQKLTWKPNNRGDIHFSLCLWALWGPGMGYIHA